MQTEQSRAVTALTDERKHQVHSHSHTQLTNENFKLNKIAIDYLKMHIAFDVDVAVACCRFHFTER